MSRAKKKQRQQFSKRDRGRQKIGLPAKQTSQKKFRRKKR